MLKVLDKVTADNVLRSDCVCEPKRIDVDANTFRFIDALMIFGRPSTIFSYKSRRVSLWVLQDQRKEKLFAISMHRNRNIYDPKSSIYLPTYQRKFSNELRNLDLKQATNYIEVGVRSLSPDNYISFEDICDIFDLLDSQLERIKNGTMEQEWFLLGDVDTSIEPIDKKAWVEDNIHLLNRLKNT